jgi:hypothetical protein
MSAFGQRLAFDVDGKAVCPESKEVYQLTNGKVIQIHG